jgi:hypothetical protein
MPNLEAAYGQTEGDVEFITIDIMENSYTVQSLMNYYDFNLPVALDSNGAVSEDYNVIYTPTNIVINSKGVIQHRKIGAFTSTEQILAIFSDLE